MSALVERIIAARNFLKCVRAQYPEGDSFKLDAHDAINALADAANAVTEQKQAIKDRNEIIRDLLQHSLSHYGAVSDDTSSIGAAQAAARHLIGDQP